MKYNIFAIKVQQVQDKTLQISLKDILLILCDPFNTYCLYRAFHFKALKHTL